VGTIPRESCADIADDFGALDVSGALKLVGTSKSAETRIDAIRAAGTLATNLKERRVALCEQYNACKATPAEHTAEDARLAGLMKSLIDAWDARKFSDPESVQRFRSKVTTLSDTLEGRGGAPAPSAAGKPGNAPPKGLRVPADDLAKIEGPGLAFRASSGSVTITSTTEGNHDALRGAAEKLRLLGGSRYLVHVSGSFKPSAPPLIAPGDELIVRFKYRAAQAGEIYVALRSLEDPDALESTATFRVAAGASGSEQAPLVASPASSGFFVGIGSRDAGAIELDDVEIVKQNAVVAAARAESPGEPHLKTSCTIAASRPLGGKSSFRCEPSPGDRLTLANPAGHLYLAIRGKSSGERALLRTLSLEGGRSLDAALTDDAELILGLSGPGSATIQSIEVEKLAK
jgi:hypothetical protein